MTKKICPLSGNPCLKEKCLGLLTNSKGKRELPLPFRIFRPFLAKKMYGYCMAMRAYIWKHEVD